MGKLFSLIDSVRKSLNLRNKVKRYYKYKKFGKYAAVGTGLDLGIRSNCDAEKTGLITVGNNCRIFGRLESQGEGRITIGDNTCIYEKSIIGSVNDIRIGDCVIISNHVHIYDNNNHPTSPAMRREMCLGGFDGDPWRWKHADNAPIVIEENVWIGEYAAVMKGVTIGKGSVIAAHSVVTKDVPPYSIAAGNPAVVVKELPRDDAE
ncbi:MAG: acyltransferase [Clostridia bacterium]|nr:acyltransferase [Clostridia bacterium]